MTTTKLQDAVVEQLGGYSPELLDTLEGIANHGADAGWCGFSYYSDTCKFFEDNQREIVELVNEMADDLGEQPMALVANFNCLRLDGPELYDEHAELRDEIGRCLYGKPLDSDTQVPNALAWFALEEVARQMTGN